MTDWTVDVFCQDLNFIVDVNFWVISCGVESYYVSVEIFQLSVSSKVLCSGDSAKVRLVIPKEKVNLWFPIGFGQQKLYTINALFTDYSAELEVLGKIEKKIGFRTAELIQDRYEDHRPGTSFFFRINGIDIFAKGTNWIPADSFESRVTPLEIRYLLV